MGGSHCCLSARELGYLIYAGRRRALEGVKKMVKIGGGDPERLGFFKVVTSTGGGVGRLEELLLEWSPSPF